MTYTRRHYDKLVRLARALDITVIEKPRGDYRITSAHCFRKNQSITIGLDNYWWFVITGLSHEIGHCLSVRKGSICSMGDMMTYRLGVVLNRAHALRVLNEEKRAWNLGFRFMRRNGIEVDATMLHARKVLLGSHKKLHEALRK
jgi:hypothetical protein